MKREHPMQTMVAFPKHLVNASEFGGAPQFFSVLQYFEHEERTRWYSGSVVIPVDHLMLEQVEAMRGAVALSPLDDDCCALVRVPLDHIERWLTEEEAASIIECWEIDQSMLRAAR